MLHRVILLILITVVHATVAIGADLKGPESTDSTTLGQVVAPLMRGDLIVNASASCAATACHGGPRAAVANEFAVRGSEYPLWLERDPHARSWRTICGEKSLEILQRLNIVQRDGQISNQAAFDNCLACHNSTGQFADSRSGALIREGVGCNSCHGPSELWKSTHYQTSWHSAHNIENGFVPTTNMFARARMCASCHIGDRNRDMNHDIIAAGHPVLYYEFTTYHQRLPKHWRDVESTDLQRYESTQWLAGQAAALDASLTLLEARAEKALPISQWPDFASYECTSCHQQIRPGSLNFSLDRNTSEHQAPSVANLSRWNRFGIESLLDVRQVSGAANASDRQLLDALANLDRVARLSSEMLEDDVAAASKSVRLQLDRWLTGRDGLVQLRSGKTDIANMPNLTANQLRDLLTRAGKRPETLSNWESATQFYLASVAARAAWPDGVQGSALSTAVELRSVLTFQPGTNSRQSKLWEVTAGYKSVPIQAGVQHWRAISSIPTK